MNCARTMYMLTRNVSLQPLELSIHSFINAVLGIFSIFNVAYHKKYNFNRDEYF